MKEKEMSILNRSSLKRENVKKEKPLLVKSSIKEENIKDASKKNDKNSIVNKIYMLLVFLIITAITFSIFYAIYNFVMPACTKEEKQNLKEVINLVYYNPDYKQISELVPEGIYVEVTSKYIKATYETQPLNYEYYIYRFENEVFEPQYVEVTFAKIFYTTIFTLGIVASFGSIIFCISEIRHKD